MIDKVTGIKLGERRPILERMAEVEGRTLSGMIKRIIDNYIKRNRGKR